jgi:hypothetical protein
MATASHIGKAGELAARGEFLLRGYNVAIPEVDMGDDVWVVLDETGQMWRIQVKTTTGKRKAYGYSGRFWISVKQLAAPAFPNLIYVLVLRKACGQWEFVVIPQPDLQEEHAIHKAGNVQGDTLQLYLTFREAVVLCSTRDWQRYRNNFDLSLFHP